MAEHEITFFRNIQDKFDGVTLKVKVLRMWEVSKKNKFGTATSSNPFAVEMILLDEEVTNIFTNSCIFL